jgi:hypothetical protein
LNVELSQLFKEQNYVIHGRQVKIVSAKGQLSELLTLISKLEPEKSQSLTAKFPT